MERRRPRPVVRIEDPEERLTVRTMPAEIVLYQLTRDQVERLGSGNAPLWLTFFGLSVGALLSSTITLLTAPLGPYAFASFLCLAILAVGTTIIFGILAAKDLRAARRRLNQITEPPTLPSV